MGEDHVGLEQRDLLLDGRDHGDPLLRQPRVGESHSRTLSRPRKLAPFRASPGRTELSPPRSPCGHDDPPDDVAGVVHARHGGAAGDLDVIRVRPDDQDPPRPAVPALGDHPQADQEDDDRAETDHAHVLRGHVEHRRRDARCAGTAGTRAA